MGTPKPVMYQDVDEALAQWVEAYQANINISGEMICQKAAQFLERLYPDAPKFEFSRSDGWPNSSNGIRYGRTVDLVRVVLRIRRSSRSPCHASAQSWTNMHLLTYTTWTKLGFSTVCKSTTHLPLDNSKATSRTRSASPSLYAATLTGLTNCHSGSSASHFAPAASRTTSTTSTTSTTPTKMHG
ncbi:unnamed protein product [Sphagnum jensenii]|uniref:HTH CENPB-type domain-containing protein n=1 Tax=Sphagnum jensenii TaxID=128206 RepID=A0ABP0W032_9BRYO